eukprot:CAMPEP_0194368378 /NCGR_PEP_ID=MMETSP0174-20130528/16650_1 /TAXON_ID=216777 /ORGANISM="Proboscia alata, Strain PI-D3" /LENGTH=162 /DNA_ID=CAMNT_0039144739 /DNA_START=24 /DNA_END=512 /DNA_ORIENTATION=+
MNADGVPVPKTILPRRNTFALGTNETSAMNMFMFCENGTTAQQEEELMCFPRNDQDEDLYDDTTSNDDSEELSEYGGADVKEHQEQQQHPQQQPHPHHTVSHSTHRSAPGNPTRRCSVDSSLLRMDRSASEKLTRRCSVDLQSSNLSLPPIAEKRHPSRYDK